MSTGWMSATRAALAVAGSALAGLLILQGHGFTPAHTYASFTAGTDLRAAVGAVVYLTPITLLSLGVAAAVRDSAAAIGLALGVPYLVPIVSRPSSPRRPLRRDRYRRVGPRRWS